ncbi:MAG: C10 family peptidase [Tannerella sp.]|jgi:hypothetical protein|nr:C10 family peptidase [Tannerella sp.]
MKKNCLRALLIIALMNFASCDNVDNNIIYMEDVKIAAIKDDPASTINVYALSVSDIVQVADLYKEMLSEDQGVISDVKYTIRKIDRGISARNVMKRGSLKEDVPLYNVDYTSEMGTKGFLLLVGDNRVKNRVIAYSDNSSFNENALDDNGVLMDLIDNYIQRSILEAENNREDKVSTNAGSIPIGEPVCFTKGKMTLLNDFLDWHGGAAPANSLTPLCPTANSHTPVGCVALAGAQIMAYHQWPRRGCYVRRASLSSDNGTFVTVNPYIYGQKDGQYMSSLTPDNTISNLCAEVGYRCGVIYACGNSVVSYRFGYLPEAFQSMGYYAVSYMGYIQNTIQRVDSEINSGRPGLYACM